MTTDLQKFEQNRKIKIANTIGSGRGLRQLGVEELGRTVSGAKKSTGKWKNYSKNQISRQLDKQENAIIEKRKNTI